MGHGASIFHYLHRESKYDQDNLAVVASSNHAIIRHAKSFFNYLNSRSKIDTNSIPIVVASSDNLILCLNAASLNSMVYKNSIRNKKYVKYEVESIAAMEITEYNIWTYADFAERVLDSLIHKPAVSAQCTTGLITGKQLSIESVNPIPFICFGGTISLYEVIADLSSVVHCHATTLKGEVIGTSGMGMMKVYHTLRAFGLIDHIVSKMKKYNSGLLITGHSIGGAVALLFTCELLMDYPELFDSAPINLITFGAPRVFTPESAAKIYTLMKTKEKFRFIRVVNKHDIISMLPSAKSHSLVHFGDVFFIGNRDIEVHSGDIMVNFPKDGENYLTEMANFLVYKASSHCMTTDHGYLPRMIAFMSELKKLDDDHIPFLNRLSKSIAMRSVRDVVTRATSHNKENTFLHHFFGDPKPLVECKIWMKLSDPNFRYPEDSMSFIHEKADLGIALGGGGLGDACLVLGWLRALNNLGLLKQAKYISSVGTAAWVHLPMTYNLHQQALNTLHNFFGPYIPPQNCTIEEVEESVSSGQGKILSNNDIVAELVTEEVEHIAEHLFHHAREIDIWSDTVRIALLQPHGYEHHSSSLLAVHGDHATRVKSLTAGWVDKVYATRPLVNHPFPIVNAGVVVGSQRGCVPVEFTPMYFGIIPYYEYGHYHGIGGCLIEPHGFTAKPNAFDISKKIIEIDPKSGTFSMTVKIQRPKFAVTIPEVLGIASANLPSVGKSTDNGGVYDNNFNPTLPTFTPECPGDHFASREQFVDGSNCDSTGVIALLRRRCMFIIACIPVNADIMSSGIEVENANAHRLGGLAGLFGRQKCDTRVNGVKSESYNLQRQVFPSDAWDELLSALRMRRKLGKPLVHRMTLDVLPNPSVVVPGGHPVTVVFCISGECQEWSNALPVETKAKIEKDNSVPLSFMEEHAMQSGLEKSNLNGFPFIPIGRKYFSTLTTGLLSQLATHQLMESASKLAI